MLTLNSRELIRRRLKPEALAEIAGDDTDTLISAWAEAAVFAYDVEANGTDVETLAEIFLSDVLDIDVAALYRGGGEIPERVVEAVRHAYYDTGIAGCTKRSPCRLS